MKLRKPVGDLTEIDLDFDKLTGADMEFCYREAIVENGHEPIVAPITDMRFHAQIVAKAAGIGVATLRKFSAADYMDVTTKAQGFLLGTV